MSVLAPLFLYLLPLAALPVLFHLFFRVRKQPRVCSSLMFFLAADPRMSARRKLREWLILALRVLCLLLLLLALARIVWRRWGGGGDAAMVLIVDNSASMAAADAEGHTRLASALAGASALIEAARGESVGVLTTVPDPTCALPEGLTEETDALLAGLGTVRATHAASTPLRALQAAVAWLSDSARAAAEIHVFTDAHENEWARPPLDLDLPPHLALSVHRVGSASEHQGTTGIVRVVPPARPPMTGRPWWLGVTLRNMGDAEAQVTLNTQLVGGDANRRQVTLPPNGAEELSLALTGAAGGVNQVRLWLEGSGAAYAGQAYAAVMGSAGERVLLIGKAADYGLLAVGLSPTGRGLLSGLLTVEADPVRLDELLASESPVMVTACWSQLASQPALAGRLAHYVEAGGVLLAVVDGRLPATTARLPPWLGAQPARARNSSAGIALTVLQPQAALWRDLRDEEGAMRLPDVHALTWVTLATEQAIALYGTEEGECVLAMREVGQGVVFTSGLALDTRWSNLPQRAAFLALVQSMALARPVFETRTVQALAGDPVNPLLASGAETAEASVRLSALAGELLSWQGARERLPVLVRAGVYRAEVEGRDTLIAVCGDVNEARPGVVSESRLPLLERVPHRVWAYTDAASCVKRVRQARQGRGLFTSLMLLALLCAVAESWVASLVRHRRAAAPGEAS